MMLEFQAGGTKFSFTVFDALLHLFLASLLLCITGEGARSRAAPVTSSTVEKTAAQ